MNIPQSIIKNSEDDLKSYVFYKFFYIYLIIFSIIGMVEVVPLSYVILSTFMIHLIFSKVYAFVKSGNNVEVVVNSKFKFIYLFFVVIGLIGVILPYQLLFTLIKFELIIYKQVSFNFDNILFSSAINIFIVGIIVVVSNKYAGINFEFDSKHQKLIVNLSHFIFTKNIIMNIPEINSIEVFMDPEYSTSENIEYIYLTDINNQLLQIPFGKKYTGIGVYAIIERLIQFIKLMRVREDFSIKINLPEGLKVIKLYYNIEINKNPNPFDFMNIADRKINFPKDKIMVKNNAKTIDKIKYSLVTFLFTTVLVIIIYNSISSLYNSLHIENIQLIFILTTFPLLLYILQEIFQTTLYLLIGKIYFYETNEFVVINKRALFLQSKDIEIPKNIIQDIEYIKDSIVLTIPICRFEFEIVTSQ